MPPPVRARADRKPTSRPETDVARIGPAGPPAVAARPTRAEHAVARRSAAMPSIARVGLRVWRLSSGLSRVLRLAAAAATMGAVAVFAYQGGERLAGLVGPTPVAPPAHPAIALAALGGDRAPPVVTPPLALASAVPVEPTHERLSERGAYYLERARGGDPAAQYNIAVLYARGDGIAQDLSAALAWFREAAAGGNAAAQFNLAVMYERGLAVGEDMAEAIAWYRRGAEQNYLPAQYNLAMAYAEGRGLPQDAVAAAGWYRQAATRGLIPAMVNFAILYEKGEGVERSLPEAYAWYRAAARVGDGDAERRARELFQQFSGEEKGRAVMAAAAVVGMLVDASKPPRGSSPKAAAPGPVAPMKSGGGTGRAVLEPKPASSQPPGQPAG